MRSSNGTCSVKNSEWAPWKHITGYCWKQDAELLRSSKAALVYLHGSRTVALLLEGICISRISLPLFPTTAQNHLQMLLLRDKEQHERGHSLLRKGRINRSVPRPSIHMNFPLDPTMRLYILSNTFISSTLTITDGFHWCNWYDFHIMYCPHRSCLEQFQIAAIPCRHL